jgi:hypothetical protein
MTKIKFRCPNCATMLSAPADAGLTSGHCTYCSTPLVTPMPGIGRASFAAAKILGLWVGASLMMALLGDAGFLLIPLALGMSVWLNWLRFINIGHSGWWGFLGLVPGVNFITSLCLCCWGAGTSKVHWKRRKALKEAMRPPSRTAPPQERPPLLTSKPSAPESRDGEFRA